LSSPTFTFLIAHSSSTLINNPVEGMCGLSDEDAVVGSDEDPAVGSVDESDMPEVVVVAYIQLSY
jgi:hypothetical protein